MEDFAIEILDDSDEDEEMSDFEVHLDEDGAYKYIAFLPNNFTIRDLTDFSSETFPGVDFKDIKIDTHGDWYEPEDIVITYETQNKLENHDKFKDLYSEQLKFKEERKAAWQKQRNDSLNSTLADDILEGKSNPSITN